MRDQAAEVSTSIANKKRYSTINAKLISSSAILPKKNPHPQKQLATAHAANPSALLFPKTAIPPLSHKTKAGAAEAAPASVFYSLLPTPCIYQTRQLFTGTIGDPFLHPNAAANPG